MGRILSCPRCKNDSILRSQPQSLREHLASLLFVVPFRCPSCSHRFLASRLWLDHPTHPIDRREMLRLNKEINAAAEDYRQAKQESKDKHKAKPKGEEVDDDFTPEQREQMDLVNKNPQEHANGRI